MWYIVSGLKPEYYCGLTGSCIYKGYSSHDIDLVLYPRDPEKVLKTQEILTALEKQGKFFGFKRAGDPSKYNLNREIWIGYKDNKRVDFFILTDDHIRIELNNAQKAAGFKVDI